MGVLARSSSLVLLSLGEILESSDTHASLTVSGESIVSRKSIAAVAVVGFDTGVDLGVSLQIMLADEAFWAVGALVLAVVQMCLDVRLDVLLATIVDVLAARIEALVLVGVVGRRAVLVAVLRSERHLNILVDILRCDSGGLSSAVDVEAGNAGVAHQRCCGLVAAMGVKMTARAHVSGRCVSTRVELLRCDGLEICAVKLLVESTVEIGHV